MNRVAVEVTPWRRFGQPTVGADDHDLSRAQVLVACWFEAGSGRYAARFGAWAAQAEPALSDEQYDDVDDPPSRHDTGGAT